MSQCLSKHVEPHSECEENFLLMIEVDLGRIILPFLPSHRYLGLVHRWGLRERLIVFLNPSQWFLMLNGMVTNFHSYQFQPIYWIIWNRNDKPNMLTSQALMDTP